MKRVQRLLKKKYLKTLIKMANYILRSILFLHTMLIVQADYNCLCNYDIEQSVFEDTSVLRHIIGYIYEFDCKAVVEPFELTNATFVPIQFEQRVSHLFTHI